jgi:hypothetical protein
MLKFTFKMDSNGNKVVKVSCKGERGFSVQTNGNLPQTHYMRKDNLNSHIVHDELRAFCGIYGTPHQRKILSANA